MNVKEITFNAMFIAIVAIMALIPNLGIIQVGALSITVLHIPVIVAGIALGTRSALIVSTAFGLSTMFVAMTRALTPFDALFANPVLSVFPRLLFGLSIAIVWNLLKSMKWDKNISISITAFVSSVLHSIFVLGTLYFFLDPSGDLLSQIGQWFIFVFTTVIVNVLIEAVTAAVLVIPLVHIIWRIFPAAKEKTITK